MAIFILLGLFSFLAPLCVFLLTRGAQKRSEEELQLSLSEHGNTILKVETDSENDSTVHVRYRDKDHSLHVVTYTRTFLGIKKVEERIMRNHNQWKEDNQVRVNRDSQ